MAYDMLVSEETDGLTVHGEIHNDGDCFVFRDSRRHAKIVWPESEIPELIKFLRSNSDSDEAAL